jgi:MFS family permease
MPNTQPTPPASHYRWTVVALLWFCGFFNYADRQAVFSVFPLLEREFGLSNLDKGTIGSAFMVVYAGMAPLAGFVVDQVSRRRLILAGLGFWSLICAATGMSRRFWQLLVFRAAEGLGESFYFPASMSMLADYHGPPTRSRAMSLHQTSVYVGTALGGFLAGYLGQSYGWRSPFWVLGLAGMVFVPFLGLVLIEPKRSGVEPAAERTLLVPSVLEIVHTPAALALLVAFMGANFVAAALLTWLPDFVHKKFGLDLLRSAAVATLVMPSANLLGAVLGGLLADRAAGRAGGRALVQGGGLLLGAPFLYTVGWTGSIPVLIAGLVGIGLCKGIYDANIFASIYDVVRPAVRGTAAGLMNSVGWAGGLVAPVAIGWATDHYGRSLPIAATAAVYVAGALAAFAAARLAAKPRGTWPGPAG